MKSSIEEICFWKKSYNMEIAKGNKLSETFEDCSECEGYKPDCQKYFNPKEYLDSIKEKR